MNKQCKRCIYSAMCLPNNVNTVLHTLFTRRAQQKGLKLLYTEFDLMVKGELERVVARLTQILVEVSREIPCTEPGWAIKTFADSLHNSVYYGVVHVPPV